MADSPERIAAALRYLQEQTPAKPLAGVSLKDAFERRVQPIINNFRQEFATGSVLGDLLRAYGSAAAPAQAAVAKGMGIPYQGPMTATRQDEVSSGENFRPMGDKTQQFVGQLLGDPLNALPMVGPAARGAVTAAKAAAPRIARGLEQHMVNTGGMLPMDTWHGSPHRFPPTAKNPLGEFDATKIGTGEGAQAYGHGLYLAENPGVAKEYSLMNPSANVSPNRILNGQELTPGSPQYHAGTLLETTGKTLPSVRKEVQGWIANARPGEDVSRYQAVLDTLNSVKSKSEFKVGSNANLYKVDLPDEQIAKMLDWDKPLSQQSWYRPVADVVKEYKGAGKNVDAYARLISKANARDGEVTGEQFYEGMLSQFGGDQAKVSAFMREAGIPGIRYLDEGSRNSALAPYWNVIRESDGATVSQKVANEIPKVPAGFRAEGPIDKRTRNFVVFDPAHMNIIGRE